MLKRFAATMAVSMALALAGGPAWAIEEAPSEPDSTRPVSPEGLVAEEVTVTVDGEPADYARADAATIIKVTFRNIGEADLGDVSVRLEGGGVKMTDATASLGDLAAGKTATGRFGLSIGAEDCSEYIGLKGTVTWTGGEGFVEVGVPARCPGARLWLESQRFSGGNGDDVADPGERLKVFVTLRNDGADAAQNVAATFKLRDGKITVIDGRATWGTIPSGASVESTTPFEIEVADDAKRPEGCTGGGIEPAVVEPETVEIQSSGSTPPDHGGGSVGSSGASEPGSPGAEEPAPQPKPASDLNDPVSDDAIGERKAEHPEMSVAFEALLDGTYTGGSFEAMLSTNIVCAMLESRGGGPVVTEDGVDADKTLAAAPQADKPGAGRAGAISLAVVLALAAGAVVTRIGILARR